jgi:hypothetical protein
MIAGNLIPKGTLVRTELLYRIINENGLRVYHYRVIFSKEEVELLMTLTADNKIAGIERRE